MNKIQKLKNSYPLNTFEGKTKEELEEVIDYAFLVGAENELQRITTLAEECAEDCKWAKYNYFEKFLAVLKNE